MELDDLKSGYQNTGNEELSKESLRKMMSRTPAVVRRIKWQLMLESALWMVFLMVYYDFFDGHNKPLIWNAILVASVVLLLTHNLLGYEITKNPLSGDDIKSSLGKYLIKIRKYSIISISSRVLAIAALFAYFMSTANVVGQKWFIVAALTAIIVFQAFALQRIWNRRIDKVKNAYKALKE